MTQLLLVSLAMAVSSVSALASMNPETGSCSRKSSDGWCQCTLVSSVDGSRHFGSVPCSILYCHQMKGWENDPNCFPPENGEPVCVFRNWQYAGACVEPADSREKCEDILSCLNDPLCVANYCKATTIRTGWTLDPIDPRSGR